MSFLKKKPQPALPDGDVAVDSGGAAQVQAKIPVVVQRHTREKELSVVFLAPALIFLLLTNVYPLLYSLRLSFYSWNMTIPMSKPRYVGL